LERVSSLKSASSSLAVVRYFARAVMRARHTFVILSPLSSSIRMNSEWGHHYNRASSGSPG
jgi:hypothetical protein